MPLRCRCSVKESSSSRTDRSGSRGVAGSGAALISTSHLQRVRKTAEFDPWVRYFSEGLRVSAIDSLRRIRTAQAHARDAVTRLRHAGVCGVAIQIAEDLVGYPVMTVSSVETRYGVSYNTANTAVSRHVELDVLRQVSEGTYNRVFASVPIIDTFRLAQERIDENLIA